MDNMFFISWDGDGIGKRVGQAILSNDPEQLNEVSHSIDAANELVAKWAQSVGGVQYSLGGDQGVYAVPAEALEDLERVKKDYEYIVKSTVTIGIGQSLAECGKALIAGKVRGKNQIVQYDDTVEQTLLETKDKVDNGSADEEEAKVGEAYIDSALEGDMKHSEECPYCKEMENGSDDHADCPYCKEMDASEEHNHDDCPYCQEMSQSHDDCEHCKEFDAKQNSEGSGEVEPDAGPTTELPTTTDSENFAGQDLNPPAISKPGINPIPMSVAPTQDTQTVNNRMLEIAAEEDAENQEGSQPVSTDVEHGQESPEDILEAIVAEGSNPNQEDKKQINENTDDEDLAIGTDMENNVSRPDDYQSDVPGTVGVSTEGQVNEEKDEKSPEEQFGEVLGENQEDDHNPDDLEESEEEQQEPQYSELMTEDLDNHAQQMQKQKVVQMVSEALEGFKQCKDILEKAKEQAPMLYTSSIAMLRAMIEMSKMLELAGAAPAPTMDQEQPGQEDENVAQAPQEESEQSPEEQFGASLGEKKEEKPESKQAPGVANKSPKL